MKDLMITVGCSKENAVKSGITFIVVPEEESRKDINYY